MARLYEAEIPTERFVTSSASRLQPMFFNFLLIPCHYLIAQLPIRQQSMPFVPVSTTKSVSSTIFLSSHRVITSTPERSGYFAGSSNNTLTETGSLAVLHGCLSQGLTATLIASGYSIRYTQTAVGLLQMSLNLALSLHETPSFITPLLPLIASKTITTVMKYHPHTRQIATPAGFIASLMVMIWQHTTPAGLWVLGITLVCSRSAEQFTQTAMRYLLPADRQPLDTKLLQGRIASLQRECQRTHSLLQEVRRYSNLDFTAYTHHLQYFTSKLRGISQDQHATLKTIIELRQGIRQLREELQTFDLTRQTAKKSAAFFPTQSSHQYLPTQSPRGYLDRILGRMGIVCR